MNDVPALTRANLADRPTFERAKAEDLNRAPSSLGKDTGVWTCLRVDMATGVRMLLLFLLSLCHAASAAENASASAPLAVPNSNAWYAQNAFSLNASSLLLTVNEGWERRVLVYVCHTDWDSSTERAVVTIQFRQRRLGGLARRLHSQ